MTEAMPFLRKPILLSYDPRPCGRGLFCVEVGEEKGLFGKNAVRRPLGRIACREKGDAPRLYPLAADRNREGF